MSKMSKELESAPTSHVEIKIAPLLPGASGRAPLLLDMLRVIQKIGLSKQRIPRRHGQ
jgi:hypothetical protein